MATIIEVGGVAPTIGEDVFLAPTAVLIGEESSIQDNAVIAPRGSPRWSGAR